MLTQGIPAYRLPKDVVARDIKNVTALGVEIVTGAPVENLANLKSQGFEAIFVAAGLQGTAKLGIPGEDLNGVFYGMDFLRRVNLGGTVRLGQRVAVIGGGNVAIDTARTALRLGAGEVSVIYRRTRTEMPAEDQEIADAEKEGVKFQYLVAPLEIRAQNGQVKEIRLQKMCLGEPDASGRRRPEPVSGDIETIAVDVVIAAIGQKAELNFTAGLGELTDAKGHLVVDPDTLATPVPGVFAGGDLVTGPSTIAKAVGQGKRAAYQIDRYLRGEALEAAGFDYRMPMVDKEEVIARQQSYTTLPPVPRRELLSEKGSGFMEVEQPMTEEEVLYSAGRCLDCGVCSQCHQCVAVCPAGAIDMGMQDEKVEAEVGSVIVATGFKLFPADTKPQYGFGKSKNVITGMQMDRLLAPTRPYNAVLRPGDGKVPDNIAFIFCAGSRDQTVDNQLCSRICCMYSIKHSQLIMGALPLADVTVYYIDIRGLQQGVR